MTWLEQRAATHDAAAQAHEESAVWHTEQAAEARNWSRLYRDLDSAVACGDLGLVHELATQLGLSVHAGRGGLEVVQPSEEWRRDVGRDGIVVSTVVGRGGRR